MEKKINLSISEGDSFFAHEVSVNFNPTQFVLDFKNITPRMDPRSQDGPTLCIKHNVVLIEPYHLKKFGEFLNKRIDDYEKEFGKIEKPKAIEAYNKKQKKKKAETKDKPQIPSYFG